MTWQELRIYLHTTNATSTANPAMTVQVLKVHLQDA